MRCKIDPGLYALGAPDADSSVFPDGRQLACLIETHHIDMASHGRPMSFFVQNMTRKYPWASVDSHVDALFRIYRLIGYPGFRISAGPDQAMFKPFSDGE